MILNPVLGNEVQKQAPGASLGGTVSEQEPKNQRNFATIRSRHCSFGMLGVCDCLTRY